MNLSIGLLFGLFFGGMTGVPGGDFALIAIAICLAVMAAIWLGISFAPGQAARPQLLELVAASITFTMIFFAFRDTVLWIYAGFGFQALWSIAHFGNRAGALAQDLYPGFALMANVGFAAAFYVVWTFV